MNGITQLHPGNYTVSTDSILKQVIFYAPLYESLVIDYKAEMYMKSRVYIRKRNHLIRYIPSMFKLKKGVREYLLESYSDLHFTEPNIYDHKLRVITGTIDRFRGPKGNVLQYFNVNVYSPTLLPTKLLSPVSASAKKYYSYRLDSVIKYKGEKAYRISFEPKKRSYQLVKGYMIVSDNVWSIREMQFSGRSEYLRFDNHVKMGEVGEKNEFLPVRYDMNAHFKFLGNKFDVNFIALFNYKSIDIKEKRARPKKQKEDYDLTDSYTLKCDTISYYTDTFHIAKVRPIELTPLEKNIYEDYYIKKDTTLYKPKPKKSSQVFLGQIGDMLIDNYTIDLAQVGSVKASPLINPLLLDYSGTNGISYKQEFKYNRLFSGDRLLRIVPRIGYNFKQKEFYWRVKADYDYWPRKRAALHINIGNGNRIYSSQILDELKEIPDSVFNFNKIHLDYFKDFYVELRHSLEITNGLTLDVGISTHKRKAEKKSEFVSPDPERYRNTYISFAPRVRISWTPKQYYYMNGDRKINLHSIYPTFILDWERGIDGVLRSTGNYERFEFDMQHRISLGLIRSLYYRFGCGAFTKQENMYFVDFVNFSKNNLPIGWSDDIGGVFQNLDRRWYNSSRKYVRGNITYEAPFLLLPLVLKNTKHVLNERLYFGTVVMPHLNPYLEAGYGIGTHIFDVGVFASSMNGKFDRVGFKITFELFNR
ncbi:hypothetical protein D0T85_19960 [Bacteroides sp. 519]|nr:hypothetical protein [Bacteroides sp. 519]